MPLLFFARLLFAGRVFDRQLYCALFGVNSMQMWAGWKFLLCREFKGV
jgi:hypothetical protein